MQLRKCVKTCAYVLVIGFIMFALFACDPNSNGNSSSQNKGIISTNGSTSMEKVIGALSEAYMQDNSAVTITYDATGSGTGIESAKNGSCDLGLSSRKLKESESGLKSYTVALDGIVLITSSQNSVDNLTLEQVSDIFTGKITNWKEVGGDDVEIACIGREAGSGTRDGFESITKTSGSCKLSQELTSTGAVLTAVSSSKNAIGYASLSTVESKSDIKKVSVDGVECTEQTVIDSTYKIQRPFNIVVSEDKELSSAAQDFLDFCLSNSVSTIIEKAGAIPVNK